MIPRDRRTLGVLVLPLVLFAVVGAVFGLLKPNVIESALGSGRAVAISAGVVAVTVALTVALWRVTRHAWAGSLAGLVPVAVFLTYTIAPAYDNDRVDEQLPGLVANEQPRPQAPAPTTTQTGAPATPSVSPPAPPPSAPSSVPSSVPPSAPAVLGRGALSGVDHRASGTALLVRLSGGALVVRVEDLDVEPGPDYEVHLVPGTEATSPRGGVKLAGLKANQGNQNYPVPAGRDLSGPHTVLIWCRAFAVPIAVAPLSPPSR